MASISRESNGRKTIQFMASKTTRKSIRLGKMSMRAAEAIKFRVEQLVTATITGHAVDDETARWVAERDDAMIAKLAAVGLVARRQVVSLGDFVDQWIAGRADVKPSTRLVYGRVRAKLIAFFERDKLLRDVTQGDADNLWQWMIAEKLAKNSARKYCGVAKQIFKSAQRHKLISANPFEDRETTVRANSDREYFIKREVAQMVLDACPDSEWRLLFALARFGGLRVPSEALTLRWEHVDWHRNRMIVPSPKTEHHEGHESREIPLFPELLPYLREAFEEAEPGTTYVIRRYRDGRQNLRTQLHRIIRRAGLKPWPKVWMNLRATRETELTEDHPLHVVCAWIGNSQRIAEKHYLQITDDHFDRALQNPVQSVHAGLCEEAQAVGGDGSESALSETVQDSSEVCAATQTHDPIRIIPPGTRTRNL